MTHSAHFGYSSQLPARVRLALRAVGAAQCLDGRHYVRPVAYAFRVSVRSVRRAQLLLEEGNRELLADTLLGRTSLTDAETIILDARVIARRLSTFDVPAVERTELTA